MEYMSISEYGECDACKHWNPETWVCGVKGDCSPPNFPCHPSEGDEPGEDPETQEGSAEK